MRKRIPRDPELTEKIQRTTAAIGSASRYGHHDERQRLQRELGRLNLLHLIDDELRLGITADVAAELKARIDRHVIGGTNEQAA